MATQKGSMNTHKSDNSNDQRYFPRWHVERRLVFHQGPQTNSQEAKTIDLSCAGVRFKTDEDIAVGQKIKMTIHFSLESFAELNGKVLRVDGDGNVKQVGVQFYNTTEEAQETILEHAFEFDREKMSQNFFRDWEKK